MALAFKGGYNDSIWSSAFTKYGIGGADISFTFLRPLLPYGSAVKHPSAMQEIQQGLQVRSLGQEDSLEKKIATYSSILSWKVHWTEEAGGLTVHGVAKRQTCLSD